jgi:hypothetical protein
MIINIGRNKENDFVIDNLKVSNFHAQMVIDDDDKIFINDLQSENGTFVNGSIINDPTELKAKDEVKIASVSFDWKKHVKNDIQEQKPAEILLEKNDKNWLAIILISLLITIVLAGSLYILNEYNNAKSNFEEIQQIQDSKEKIDDKKNENNSKKNKDYKKEKPKKKIIKPVKNEISYDYSCLEDDKDRGTTSLINIASEIGDEIVAIGTENVTLKEEINFASNSHKKLKEDYQFIYNYKQKKLSSILKKIEKEIINPKGYNYKIYLVKDKTINAFTTGGGYIYFFEGMYDYLKNDDEIAAIICHEINHNELGHLKDYLRVKKTNNTFFGELGNILTNVQSILTINFNQRKETQCDLHAIDLSIRTGYNECSTPNIWKRMKDEEGNYNSINNLFRSHPYSEKRELCAKNHLFNNYNVNCK